MSRLSKTIDELENFKAVSSHIHVPNKQTPHDPMSQVMAMIRESDAPLSFLDLGCGEGGSFGVLGSSEEKVQWHGVDIEGSPEVKRRVEENSRILSYNGVDLPYDNDSFDIVYCNQVLEHVRYPDALIAEVCRVLKPKGVFLGSVSYLEPFHSYSVFNWTPYGVATVLGDAGLAGISLSAGSDASQLIHRQLLNRSKWLRFLWNRPLYYWYTRFVAAVFRLPPKQRVFLRLMFAGHIVFSSYKPGERT